MIRLQYWHHRQNLPGERQEKQTTVTMIVGKQFFSGLIVGLLIGVLIGSNGAKSMPQCQTTTTMSLEHGKVEQKASVSFETIAKTVEPKEQGLRNSSLVCDLSNNLAHLQTKEADYPRQGVFGPMQADEMLAVFSIIRTSSVKRVLEIGGFKGDSAWNFLEALRCKQHQDGDDTAKLLSPPVVYTVDLNPVKTWHDHPVMHKTFVKDASKLGSQISTTSQ